MDSTIQSYLPPYPRRTWMREFVLWMLAILVIGTVIFIVTTVDHNNDINEARSEHDHIIAQNQFWEMVAGKKQADESVLGRLAVKLYQLQQSNHPLEVLENYYVNPHELDTAREQLGWEFFSISYKSGEEESTSNTEGHFESTFVLDAYEARHENLSTVLKTVPPLGSQGKVAGVWLFLIWFVWVAVLLGGIWLLSVSKQRWEKSKSRAFQLGLTPEQRDILKLLQEIESRPQQQYLQRLEQQAASHRKKLLNQAHAEPKELRDQAKRLFDGLPTSRGWLRTEVETIQRRFGRMTEREEKNGEVKDQPQE